jgi:hypothetical protein
MQTVKKWLWKRHAPTDTQDITRLAKRVGPIIDQAANDIFRSYNNVLLERPVSFLVSAVWGGDGYSKMDAVSTGINRMVVPALHNALTALDLKMRSPSHEFAVTYLIRGLIISKIAFMVESAKNVANGVDNYRGDHPAYELRHVEPLGSA